MMRPFTCLLLLITLLPACTHRQASRGESRLNQPRPLTARTLDLYAFDPGPCPPPTERLVLQQENYSVHRIHFPDRVGSLFPADGLDAVEYRPLREGTSTGAGILILPIQGAEYEVSTYFAEYFASRGFSCLRFQRRAEWLVPERDLSDLAPLVREYVTDVRRGLQWWRESGRVDPGRIGLFGVSMGAIIGSIVTALEGNHLQASVLVLGGGPLAEILMTADDKEIRAFREGWMEKAPYDEEALRRKLHRVLDPVDPLEVAPLIRPASTLMIQGRFDRVVRPPLGANLWEAAGRTERILIPTGHYSSVLLIRSIRKKALNWFEPWLLTAE
jgi:hypothetical protein